MILLKKTKQKKQKQQKQREKNIRITTVGCCCCNGFLYNLIIDCEVHRISKNGVLLSIFHDFCVLPDSRSHARAPRFFLLPSLTPLVKVENNNNPRDYYFFDADDSFFH